MTAKIRARRRRIAVGVAAVLVAAGCGSRVDRDTWQGAMGPGDVEPGTTTAPPGASGSTTTTAPEDGGAGDEGPCGPGDASGATDVGVTDTEITIATIQDIGGPVPGMFQGNQDAMEAFVAWCNSLGGVNGRTLRLLEKDTGLFEPRPAIEESCREAFAIVGSGYVFDDATVEPQSECGIPEVAAFTSTPAHADAPLTVTAVPSPSDQTQAGASWYFAEHFPDAVEKAAIFYADAATTKDRAYLQMEAYEAAGFTWVHEAAIPITELNWGPHAEELRSKGVGYVTVWADFTAPVKLVRELHAQQVDVPIVEIGAQSYDPDFIEQAGEAAEGAYVLVSTWPFEEADGNPELQRYLEWLEKAKPGAKPTSLAIHGWSAGLLFATVVDSLGSDVTREGLLAGLREVHEWTGRGIHGLTDPGSNGLTECVVILQVRDGEFARVFPDEGFSCDERNVGWTRGSSR
ncbi:MAG: ABC transporter substrate-binding protein [Acidimicrobiia bacterium]|nr:ABC transporter substrate-binding protein [Acidimicrobiia bacterium]